MNGREFTCLTDLSRLKKFFEGDDLPTHMVQQWHLQLLQYDFSIVHQPTRILEDVDLLLRYNAIADSFREV